MESLPPSLSSIAKYLLCIKRCIQDSDVRLTMPPFDLPPPPVAAVAAAVAAAAARAVSYCFFSTDANSLLCVGNGTSFISWPSTSLRSTASCSSCSSCSSCFSRSSSSCSKFANTVAVLSTINGIGASAEIISSVFDAALSIAAGVSALLFIFFLFAGGFRFWGAEAATTEVISESECCKTVSFTDANRSGAKGCASSLTSPVSFKCDTSPVGYSTTPNLHMTSCVIVWIK